MADGLPVSHVSQPSQQSRCRTLKMQRVKGGFKVLAPVRSPSLEQVSLQLLDSFAAVGRAQHVDHVPDSSDSEVDGWSV